jgi:hypothetical protein
VVVLNAVLSAATLARDIRSQAVVSIDWLGRPSARRCMFGIGLLSRSFYSGTDGGIRRYTEFPEFPDSQLSD